MIFVGAALIWIGSLHRVHLPWSVGGIIVMIGLVLRLMETLGCMMGVVTTTLQLVAGIGRVTLVHEGD